MINLNEFNKYFSSCRNCNTHLSDVSHMMTRFYKDLWNNTRTTCCIHCYDEVEQQTHDKYFIEEVDGIGIYKFNDHYFFGLYSGMSVETIEDARLMVTGVINKKLR